MLLMARWGPSGHQASETAALDIEELEHLDRLAVRGSTRSN